MIYVFSVNFLNPSLEGGGGIDAFWVKYVFLLFFGLNVVVVRVFGFCFVF